MTKNVKLYDLSKGNYPLYRGGEFRSIQVFKCPICGALTNRILIMKEGHLNCSCPNCSYPNFGKYAVHVKSDIVGKAESVPTCSLWNVLQIQKSSSRT